LRDPDCRVMLWNERGWDYTVRQFLRITRVWILAIPLLIGVAGAASNQLVLIANHDKFPVMLNEHKRAAYEPDSNGMLDDEHVVMTSATHLNFLADYLDFKSEIESPGDLLLELADYLTPFAPLVWGVWLILDKLRYE